MPHISEALVNRPVWFDLSTSDLEAAKTLYQELFGWTFGESHAEMGHYTMAFRNGIPVAAVAPQMPGQEMGPVAWTIYFGVRDADATVARITEHGGSVMVPPMAIPPDLGRMAIVVDPDGAVFGLWEHGSFSGAGLEGEHGAMAWSEVNARHAVKDAEFYAKVFDLTTSRMEDDSIEYHMLHDGDPVVAGVLQMDAAWGDLPPHWMPYFAVDDLDVADQVMVKHGGKILNGPIPSPYGNIMVVQDAQGAVFSYISTT